MVVRMCVSSGGGLECVCLYEHCIHLFPRDRAGGESVKLCMIMLSQSRLSCRTVPLSFLSEFAGTLHNVLLLPVFLFNCVCSVLTMYAGVF